MSASAPRHSHTPRARAARENPEGNYNRDRPGQVRRQQCRVWSVTTINYTGEHQRNWKQLKIYFKFQIYFKKVYLNFKKSFSTTFRFFQMLKVHIIHHDYNSFFFMSVCFTTNIISNLSPLHFEVLNTWKVSTILLHLFAAQLTTVSDEGGISNILKFMWLYAASNLFFHLCTYAH